MGNQDLDRNHDGIVSDKEMEHWMNQKWRPAMAWMYMVVCVFDFILFPIMWTFAQYTDETEKLAQWIPITMQGAGFFHITMGVIIGISTWKRTEEKMAGKTAGTG